MYIGVLKRVSSEITLSRGRDRFCAVPYPDIARDKESAECLSARRTREGGKDSCCGVNQNKGGAGADM